MAPLTWCHRIIQVSADKNVLVDDARIMFAAFTCGSSGERDRVD
jgi:hypothetical protein